MSQATIDSLYFRLCGSRGGIYLENPGEFFVVLLEESHSQSLVVWETMVCLGWAKMARV